MIVISEYEFKNLPIHEVTSAIENIQHELIDKYGFIDKYKVSVICHTEYIDGLKKKTQNVIINDFYLICRSKKRDTASNSRYKLNRVKKLIVIIQGGINKLVINTYLKMQMPMLWRKFLMKNANKRFRICFL